MVVMQAEYRPLRALVVLTVLSLGFNHSVQSAAPAGNGRQLYAPCVVCHQPNAWGSPDGLIPNLAGQQARYLERQLATFRSGARVDTAMQVVAAHPTFGSQENIAALAAYLSALIRTPFGSPVPGRTCGWGRRLTLTFAPPVMVPMAGERAAIAYRA